LGGDRSTEADGELPQLVDRQQLAEHEAKNTLRQYDALAELIQSRLRSKKFRLRSSDLLDLHRVALEGLSLEAGVFRRQGVRINKAEHMPPRWEKVPSLVDEMCEYVNDNWSMTAVHLSAFAMWRLNWIHPFIDGNGRTSRAISYLVLCTRAGSLLPGDPTVPELIANDHRSSYYDALIECDRHYREVAGDEHPAFDVSPMEELMKKLVAKQLSDLARAAGAL
jgi:Fic family protein